MSTGLSSYLLEYSCTRHRHDRFGNVNFFGIGTLKLNNIVIVKNVFRNFERSKHISAITLNVD